MRKLLSILIIVICWGSSSWLSAQPNLEEAVKMYPDSLSLYEQLIRETLNGKPDDSYKYIIEALDRSVAIDDQVYQAIFNKALGAWHGYHGDSDSSLYFFEEAKKLYKLSNHIEGVADITNNIGYNYFVRAQYKEAIPYYLEAANIYDSIGSKEKYASSLTNMGMVYQANNEEEKALEKYYESNRVIGSDQINRDNIRTFVNIAALYNRMKKYDSAIVYFKRVIEFSQSVKNIRALSYSYNNIAASYEGNNQMDKALESAQKAYSYKVQLNDSIGMVTSLSSLSGISNNINKPRESIRYGEMGLEINKRTKVSLLQMDLLFKLGMAYNQIGKYKKSADFYNQYIIYKDSIDRIQEKAEIAELMEKYESSQKEQEIVKLQLEKKEADLAIQKAELAIQKSDNQRNLLLLSVGLFIILVAFFMYRNRQKQKTNRLLEEKNMAISNSLHEKEVLLKEIHHRVKNNLQIVSSLLNLQLDSLEDPNAMEAIKEGQNRVKSMALIHQKLYMQENLAGINTKEYLEALSESIFSSYNQLSERVTLSADVEDLDLEIDTIIPIALIVNELITNSIKYAFPENMIGKISVTLKRMGEVLRLEVADDGVGMNAKSDGTSFGMKLVRSLARKLKATVSTESFRGTKVQLDISRFKVV